MMTVVPGKGDMAVSRIFCVAVGLMSMVSWMSHRALAEPISVDLRLVLAVDISRSMDPEEQLLQRAGYVAAFLDPRVLEAIDRGPLGRIAVTYVEWAGPRFVIVPWTLIDGKAAARLFAERLAREPLRQARRTSISGALMFSAGLFGDRSFDGPRRVIDISGDGPNNIGQPVTEARDRVLAQGITINGLPILLKAGNLAGFFDVENLDIYYETCVIGGLGAFIVAVTKKEGFANAILRKMILEIAGLPPPPNRHRASDMARSMPVQYLPGADPTDCLVGEKLWDNFMGDP